MTPSATASLEVHLAGPAWLVVTGVAGWSRWRDTEERGVGTSAGARVGPRFEWNVVDRFDAGFYGMATGNHWHGDASPDEVADSYDVGGVAGASVHFRASRVFGVRVAIDLLRAGHSAATIEGAGDVDASYLQLGTSPTAELTFTF